MKTILSAVPALFAPIITFCIGAYMFGWIFGWIIEKFTGVGEQTVYVSRCNGFAVLEECGKSDGFRSVAKIGIKTDFSHQRVVISDPYAETYECSVLDSENWECEKGDRKIYMRDGDYFDSISGSIENRKVMLRQMNSGWIPYFFYQLKNLF